MVKLGNEVAARAEDPLAGLGLSGRQYMALAMLGSDEPSSQLELARLCGLLPAQVVPVVDELERRGLVERQRDEARPPPLGRPRHAAGAASCWRGPTRSRESIEDALFGELDPAAREQFADAMRAALARAHADD